MIGNKFFHVELFLICLLKPFIFYIYAFQAENKILHKEPHLI